MTEILATSSSFVLASVLRYALLTTEGGVTPNEEGCSDRDQRPSVGPTVEIIVSKPATGPCSSSVSGRRLVRMISLESWRLSLEKAYWWSVSYIHQGKQPGG